MHARPMCLLLALRLGLGLVAGLVTVSAPAQASTRAYEPEKLSQLSVSDQTRPTRPAPGNGDNYRVTCSSNNSRFTTCAWEARRGRPYLIERLSNQPCTSGYSWGYSARTGLWVNHGCRARFGAR